MFMNLKTSEVRNATTKIAKRTALLFLAASVLSFPSHGQNASGFEGASDQVVADSSASGAIPPAVMKELEAMKKRIEQLEAQLQRHGQEGTGSAVEGIAEGSKGPNAPGANLAAASLAQPSLAQPQNETAPPAASTPAPQPAEPFAFADWTWLNGNARTKEAAFDSKFFTPEIRADVSYIYDFNSPRDNTIGGSSEVFRSGEVQVTQLGVGGDFHYDNVRARLMTQFGMYSQTTPRNDASVAHGQWNLDNAYRYVSEAYGGDHFNALHGINLDAGIFVSYIGLFSYYNFDNWAYQPSYVSSNTPWFFNGVRLQVFPTAKWKIEPWFINGWQSYGKFNKKPGLGGQINYRPNGRVSIILNNYGLGTDALGVPNRTRFHTDDSIEVKYYDNPGRLLDKAAFTFTGEAASAIPLRWSGGSALLIPSRALLDTWSTTACGSIKTGTQ